MLTTTTNVRIGSKTLTIAQAVRLWKSTRIWRAIKRQYPDAGWAEYAAAREATGWAPGAITAEDRRDARRTAYAKPKTRKPKPAAEAQVAFTQDQLQALLELLTSLAK